MFNEVQLKFGEMEKKRLQEVLRLASKLNWIYPIEQPNKRNYSYPLMQLSEVEKCMIAFVDDSYFKQMKEWCGE